MGIENERNSLVLSVYELMNNLIILMLPVTRDVKTSPFSHGSELLISCMEDLWKYYSAYYKMNDPNGMGQFAPSFNEKWTNRKVDCRIRGDKMDPEDTEEAVKEAMELMKMLELFSDNIFHGIMREIGNNT